MSGEMLEALDSLIAKAIADGATPGAALAVGRGGELVRLRGYGRLDWDPVSPAVTPSTIYDLASLTKVVATTTAVMILLDEGRLDPAARVIDYIPWWAEGDRRKREVTVEQLLLHRAGLAPFQSYHRDIEGGEAFRRAIGAERLVDPPGTRTVYSDIGMITMAFIVEEITGTTMDAFLAAEVWEPLGLEETFFSPDSVLVPRIAPTEIDQTLPVPLIRGFVHDENARALGGTAGHAGLFSSARDLAVFAEMMLRGGVAIGCVPVTEGAPRRATCGGAMRGGGRGMEADRGTGGGMGGRRLAMEGEDGEADLRLLRRETVERFTRRHDFTSSRALGWDTPSGRSSAGEFFTASAFGHTGFTGTSIWIDPELDLFVVLLTNRVNPSRANTLHIPLRRAVHDAAARAIMDRPVLQRVPCCEGTPPRR